VLPPDTVVIVDFLAARPADMRALKALNETSECRMIALVDLQNRAQVMQVRELGIYHLIDRNLSIGAILAELRDKLGDYGQPALSDDVSEAMKATIRLTCTSLNELGAAALTGSALPAKALLRSAREIFSAIEAEGIGAWISAVQQHHSHTFCHTMMVTGHTLRFSEIVGLPERDRTLMGFGALVHDLGKIKIPLSILDKPGSLTEEERKLVNLHPAFGKQILQSCGDIPKDIYEIAVSHHEFIDGTGYPVGLKDEEISHRVRMVTICDIYSALTEQRAYKDSYSPRQAFAIMAEMGGKLDRQLLRTFRDSVLGNDLGHLRRTAV
jgi:HD-GYP domain-containing protein (c-di-GMP phosphodiesterase class II)